MSRNGLRGESDSRGRDGEARRDGLMTAFARSMRSGDRNGSSVEDPREQMHRAGRSESLRDAVHSMFGKRAGSSNPLGKIQAINSWSRLPALRRQESSQSEGGHDMADDETAPRWRRYGWLLAAPFSTPSAWWNWVELFCGVLAVLLAATRRRRSWSPYEEDHHGVLKFDWCKSRLACADSAVEKFFGVVARFTGGAIYAVLAFTLSTMAHATTNYLGRRPQVLMSSGLFGTSHVRHGHVHGGKALLRLSVVHGAFHVARWAVRGDLTWALQSPMVVVGLIATASFCAVGPFSARKKTLDQCLLSTTAAAAPCANKTGCCCPTSASSDRDGERARKTMTQKTSHERWFLISHHVPVVLALATAALHVERLAVVSTCFLGIYLADRLYLTLFRTFLVRSPHYVAIDDDGKPSGTLISFNNPPHFDYETGDYVQIRLPWLDGPLGHQYHPFSLAPIGDKTKNRAMVYAACNGDWTRAVHDAVQLAGNGFGRPCLMTGPYVAPFNSSVTHNYVLVVASGIGITPCLAVLERYGATRNVVVLWISRDAALLRLYSNYLDKSICRRAIVYYTGHCKGDKFVKLREDLKPLRVRGGRPDIKRVVTKILCHTVFKAAGDLEDGEQDSFMTFGSTKHEFNPDLPTTVERLKHRDSGDGGDHDDDDDPTAGKDFIRIASGHSDISVDLARPLPVRELTELWTPDEAVDPTSPQGLAGLKSPRQPLPNIDVERAAGALYGKAIAPSEWRVLYCGGSKAIGDILEAACTKTGASYASESFWL